MVFSQLSLRDTKKFSEVFHMQKVIFSVSKSGKFPSKSTGIGYIDDENLYIPALSQKGNPYIRVFPCISYCHSIVNRPDEFKGNYSEIREVEIPVYDRHDQTSFGTRKINPNSQEAMDMCNGYETREIEISYFIWFKKLSGQRELAI